ncbi:hypothetical protein C1H46_000013 [Malus baccata]|uniref:phosphoglycerate mutase (2,3-diphosphoglycerate-dependent) n=1 Tax=Malus baccata TaxID=106549 RepID=A0A540NST0_MALBA|nr:hypothetical protein C1H46_000013 [Malus baccata]
MVATAFRHPVGVIQLHGSVGETGSARNCRQSSFRFISKKFAVDVGLLRKEHCSSRQCRLHVIRSSSSQASTTDPILSTSHGITNNAQKTSSVFILLGDSASSLLILVATLLFAGESSLILICHGESLWNEKNLFTGCVDVPLTKKGVDEALEAGKRISNIPVDMIYTSLLIRAQMTAMLAMTQHHRKKVPIVVHNESIQAKTWGQIYSGDTKKQSIPVITAWQLNERMYGELQGLNKLETAERYGKEQVHEWRRSFDIPPPSGESLEMCSQRAVAYFKEQEGEFMRRGSPVGPTEPGVYAYTKGNLAVFKEDEEERGTEEGVREDEGGRRRE